MLKLMYFLLLLRFSNQLNPNKFPDDFLFGVATSAYQIEGAWDEDGKGENIWDHYTHLNRDKISGKGDGDIACDSYHRVEEDVELIKGLNVDYYRFSLSWSRLLPDGVKVNQKGIDYYNSLIDALVANNITPMVTLYHWDLPQKLQEYGGWVNPHMVDFFEKFAKLAFDNFGDRVKYWLTFNEPYNICVQGYSMGIKAPGLVLSGFGEYYCMHTLIKSHAKVYHLYQTEYKEKFKGKISLALDSYWLEPESDSEEDVEAAERAKQFTTGWVANPIFLNGDYPEIMKEIIKERSNAEGLHRSRLPSFTEEEKSFIKGTHDFFAFNTYTAILVKHAPNNATTDPSWLKDIQILARINEDWSGSASHWLKVAPWAFKKLLVWLKKHYGNLEFYVTENGYSDNRGEINDVDRIIYHEEYLSALLDAIDAGVNVKAYTFWTLMDNFEWTEGYEHVFGLYYVDFDNPELPRLPKKSVGFVKDVIKHRGIRQPVDRTAAVYIRNKDEL